ncbi:MAG: Riboflavin biosynthesis protein RibD [Turneriella sp.]|nr:Riboflavin biosynthesis protein RibD [Turneriella sp.]
MDDLRFLGEAYIAALGAVGNSDPNPAVGALVVSENGKILARGTTERAGYLHAERDALLQLAHDDLTQATLYVTLEPCCHHGRTPPCVDIILERKIKRVVIAERDFAAQVQGKSVALLRDKGVEVKITPEETFVKEAYFTTGPFFFAQKYKRPRVTLKWAETKDGKMAPREGASGKISGETAAFVTAALRSFHKYTLATPGTTLADLPKLNVRFPTQSIDFSKTHLSTTLTALLLLQPQIFGGRSANKTKIKSPARGFLFPEGYTREKNAFNAFQESIDSHFTIFPFEKKIWKENFSQKMELLLTQICKAGFNSLLIEAGPTFAELLFAHHFVDAVAFYRSKTKDAESLWEKDSRASPFSSYAHEFTQIECGDLGDDEFFFYRHNNR